MAPWQFLGSTRDSKFDVGIYVGAIVWDQFKFKQASMHYIRISRAKKKALYNLFFYVYTVIQYAIQYRYQFCS